MASQDSPELEKDEAAKILVEEFGFTRVAFADKLREVLYALNPIISDMESLQLNVKVGEERKRVVLPGYEHYTHVYVQNVIDQYGWDGYKETPYGNEIRRLLQRLGTEAGRQTLWDTIWVDAAFANLPPDANIVVPDARFLNEFEAIESRGGEIWRINRTSVGPANSHASEMEALTYTNFAAVIENDSTLASFQKKIRLRGKILCA